MSVILTKISIGKVQNVCHTEVYFVFIFICNVFFTLHLYVYLFIKHCMFYKHHLLRGHYLWCATKKKFTLHF